jgi:hypothetical protein
MIPGTSNPPPQRSAPASKASESLSDFFSNVLNLISWVVMIYIITWGINELFKLPESLSGHEEEQSQERAAEDSEAEDTKSPGIDVEEPPLAPALDELLNQLTIERIADDWSLMILVMKKYDYESRDYVLRWYDDKIPVVLQRLADSQLHLFDQMQPVKITTSDDLPALGAFMYSGPNSETQEGLKTPDDFEDLSPSIVLNLDFVLHASIFEVYDVLLHELTHAWVHDGTGAEACYNEGEGYMEHGGHCSLFIEKALSLGLEVGAEVNVFSSVFWTYARLRTVRWVSHLGTLGFWPLAREANALLTGEGRRPPNTLERLERRPHFPRQFLQWL